MGRPIHDCAHDMTGYGKSSTRDITVVNHEIWRSGQKQKRIINMMNE